MVSSRRYFVFVCLTALTWMTIHRYYDAVLPLGLFYEHGHDLLQIPQAINYVPSNEKVETVIRQFVDSNNPIRDPSIPVDENNYRLILFHTLKWGVDFIEKSWNWSTDGTFHYPDPKFKCPKKCKTTMDTRLAKDAHAVVFSILEIQKYPNLETRNQNQIWVGFTLEPPFLNPGKPAGQIGHLFNWTWTNRLDSDVYLPYRYFYKLETPKALSEIQLPDMETLRTKILIASLISHCGAESGRDHVIETMKKYVSVDAFGGCGESCPVPDCRRWLAGQYKFFLAFENSLCQDYITEKFFQSFEVGLVPVTYGFGDYAEVAPPHSYINALDFPTVKALTDYLVHLDENDHEYLKYFHWKQEYALGSAGSWNGVHHGFAAQLCSLCLKLWEPMNFTQQITNFNDWWNRKRPSRIQSNTTIAGRLLQDTKTACVDGKQVLGQGYLI